METPLPPPTDLPAALAASFTVAAASLAARLVAWVPARRMGAWLPWLQAVAAGLLLGDALLHMVPEAMARGISVARTTDALALGILCLVCVECVVRASGELHSSAAVARMNLIGDTLHHLVDGIVIGASFAIDRTLGLVVAMAILGHELPREMGSAGVLVAGGYTPRRAFQLSIATATAAPIGTMGVLALGQAPAWLGTCLALAAGTTVYLACGDVLPALWQNLQRRHRFTPAFGVAGGLAFMWLATVVDHVR